MHRARIHGDHTLARGARTSPRRTPGVQIGSNLPTPSADPGEEESVESEEGQQAERFDWRVEREYVWAPAAAGGRLDELLAQFDAAGSAWLVPTDPSLTPMGLAAGSGVGVESYTFEPYGRVVSATPVSTPPGGVPIGRVGFQGKFAERLNGGTLDATLTPASRLLYHFNNRTLDPLRGRFLQRDPHQTGQPIVDDVWRDGEAPDPNRIAFDAETLYADGFNLYPFAGADSINRSDALGLFIGLSLGELGAAVGQGIQRSAMPLTAISASYTLTRGILGQISTQQMVIELLAEAIGGKAFWMVGGRIEKYFSAAARVGGQAAAKALRYVPDDVVANHRLFGNWIKNKHGNPFGPAIPAGHVDEVIETARKLGFEDIVREIGGRRSGTWAGKPHLHMRAPGGGTRLHLLIE